MEEELQVCFKTFEISILGGDDCFKGYQTTTGHIWPALWDGRTILANDSTQLHPWERFWVPSLLWGGWSSWQKLFFSFFKTTAASLLRRWCLPPAGSSSAATATWSARSANRDKRFDLVLLAGRVDDNGNANDEHLHKDVPCKNWWKFMKIHSNVWFLGCPWDHRLSYETFH